MTLNIANYESRVKKAVQTFWTNRSEAGETQSTTGTQDQGERGSVTAGRNMDGFRTLGETIVRENGLSEANIHVRQATVDIPGFFRSSKKWDILVTHHDQLVAAVEFKSQVGSFGNNINNRAEEAIGSAKDFWTAYREGTLGKESPKPFLGWFTLVEDCEESRRPVRNFEPHFPVLREFADASYAERYNLLCRKLVQEQLYTSATVILSPRSAITDGAYSEISELTGVKTFVTALAGHIATAAARRL
jgi:hypothetical protein